MFTPYKLEDVKRAASKELFTFADFFAGGGGSSTGIKLAGGKELWVNEFVDEAYTTFSANYPDARIIKEDIKELNGQHFLDYANIQEGEIDLVTGSPPCSAFSAAGKGSKNWGKTKTYSDGKKVDNIEDLFFEYIRVLNDIRPKVILAENVAGLTQGKSITYLSRIQNAFNDIGYVVTYKLMKACDYTVSQVRTRIIFIAVRNDVADVLDYGFFGVPNNVFPPKIIDDNVSIKDAIDGIENDPEEVQKLLASVQSGFQKDILKRLPLNPEFRHCSPSDKEHTQGAGAWNPKGSYFGMIRPCVNLPCPTITQRGAQLSTCGVVHYAHDRKFTIKELKRIMALPDDYILTGTFDQQAERVGRMVVPIMLKYIAESVYLNILKPYNERIKNDR